MAGLSKGSDTLKLAGERGYIPMSLNLNPAYVGSHWASVEAGAAKSRTQGRPGGMADGARGFRRRDRRGGAKLSVGLHMGRMMREYFLPLLKEFDFLAIPEA